jgi:hypothetical protein
MASDTLGTGVQPALTLIVPVPPELAGDMEAFDRWRIEMGAGLFNSDPSIATVRAVWNRAEGLAEFTAFTAAPGPEGAQSPGDECIDPFDGWEPRA